MKKKISAEKLRNLLNEGTVSFSYEKINGELREAVGTTNINQIPASSLCKGGETPGNKVSYYDLVKGGWRSVSMKDEIRIYS